MKKTNDNNEKVAEIITRATIKEEGPQKSQLSVANTFPSGITLKIIASKEDWEKLRFKAFDAKSFSIAFYDYFIRDALDYLERPNNEKRRTRSLFAKLMEIQAALLYGIFSFSFKKTQSKWPAYIINIELIEGYKELLLNKHGKPDATAYTAYCMQLVYSKYFEPYSIKPFLNGADLMSFYKRYIYHGNKSLKNIDYEKLNYVNNLLLLLNKRLTDTDTNEFKNIIRLLIYLSEAYLISNMPDQAHGINENDLESMKLILDDLGEIFPHRVKD